MKRIDARKLTSEVQQHNRDLATRLFEQDQKRADIAEIIGVHYGVVCRWIRSWKKSGRQSIKLGKRGRSSEEQRRLTTVQESALKKVICDKNPDQMKLPFALWNRKAIQGAIKQMWGVNIAIRTVGDYLKRWGYAPKGQTPIVEISAKRFSTNMISAINNQGAVRFMMYKENMTAKVLLRFMRRLIKDAGRKVFLILDNLRVHHAKLVKAWLIRRTDKIEVFYLPAYSPDLNPDEYLNADLKSGIRSAAPARNQADLANKVLSHMRMLQKKPKRVAKYFNHPAICYAS